MLLFFHYVLLVFLLFFLILSFLWIISGILSFFYGVPYIWTKKKEFVDIISRISIKKGMKFLDMGSGDGRNVFYMAKKYGVSATGIEANILLYGLSRALRWLKNINNAHLIHQRAEHANFRCYDVIYTFLIASYTEKVDSKLKKECKKGTIIISHGFKLKKLNDKLFYTLNAKPFCTYYYKL